MKEDIKAEGSDTSVFVNAKGLKVMCRSWSCQKEGSDSQNPRYSH